MKSVYQVIEKPIISEKSALLTESMNKYTFRVHPKASKEEISEAVSTLFKVKVKKVHTMFVHGDVRMSRRARAMFKEENWKKAIVTVGEGEKIEFFKS